MVSFRVVSKFDPSKLTVKASNVHKSVKKELMSQVLVDSNTFCRQDQGGLIESSEIHSRPDYGVLVWRTPYARIVYFTGTPSKDVNRNASLMWYHKAKGKYGKQWGELVRKVVKRMEFK